MELQREKEFVSQYHFDARNFEWEKEKTLTSKELLEMKGMA